MRRLLPILLALTAFLPLALAQNEEAEALLQEVTATAESLQDAAFLLTGYLVDADGTEIALELEMQIIPDATVASAYILQPDALADNIIVLDRDTVYNYTFLTNQVTVFDADDPDALGGLFGGGGGGAEAADDALEFTFDLQQLFSGYQASLVGSVETPLGPATMIRLDNVDEEAIVQRADATIAEATSLPYRLQLYQADGTLMAELVVKDLRTDISLAPGDVTYLPEDAEIIDERED